MKNISLKAYKTAEALAAKEISDAIGAAMKRFNVATGVLITGVSADIIKHYNAGRADEVLILGVKLETDFKDL